MDKTRGKQHHLNKKKQDRYNKWESRSKVWFGKLDKCRNLRKKADRHSHHRRRNHMRSASAHGILDKEYVPPPSSTKRLGKKSKSRTYWPSGHSNKVSNKKTM